METTNQRETRLKKAPSGMEPLLPVWWMSRLSTVRASSVMPGK